MNTNDVFKKTAAGAEEVKNTQGVLSMQIRRVLILINGSQPIEKIAKLSKCENIEEVVATLDQHGFIELVETKSTPTPANDFTAPAESGGSSGPAEIMVNTLMAYGNRVRVKPLVDKINAAGNMAELREHIKPWYQAVSETPGGMYEVDKFKSQILEQIENLESRGG